MKKTLKIIGSTLGIIILLVLIMYIYLAMGRSSSLRKQRKHMNKLHEMYETYTERGSNEFSENDFLNTPFNEVRFLASHNSYKKNNPALGRLFVGLGDSFDEAKSMKYSNKTLTEQFKNGIYSLELDVRFRKGKFEVTHVPIVDNKSVVVDFKLALKEIKMFLDNEPNSFPISVILEIKDDYNFLDPFIKSIGSKQINILQGIINEIMDDKLITPNDLLKKEETLQASIDKNGWPLVNDLKGKAMFILHAGKHSDNHNKDTDIETATFFTSTYKNTLHDNSPFVIHNDLDVDSIKALVDNNKMVRTRIGSTLKYNDQDVEKAISSGAQILTTDFSAARSDINSYLYFNKKFTIMVKE